MRDIADVLGYPLGFFRQPVQSGGLTCLYHRKRKTIRAGDIRRIDAECTIAGLVVRNVTSGLEIETDYEFPIMDIDEYESPAEIARATRRYWGVPDGPIRNLVRVIESAGGVVLLRPFRTTKLDAISQWPVGQQPLFIVNIATPWDRIRFTLAHEIGHLVMHGIPSPEKEAEADSFAAEFLMPATDIAGDLAEVNLPKVAMMKGVWRVSMAALVRRARDLGTITEYRYRYLFKELSRLGHRRVEPMPISPEEPTVLADVLRVHREEGMSDEELAQLARVDVREMLGLASRGPRLRLISSRQQ